MKDHDSLLSQEIQGAIHCVWVALCSSALSHEYLIEYAHVSNDKASLFYFYFPTGHKYEGVKFEKGNCGVSIMRSGRFACV